LKNLGKFIETLPTQNEILTPVLSETNETAAPANKTARRSDHELQLARRIDWRFLLPEPYLRRVAYLGPERGALPAALEHFSDSFRMVSAVDDEAAFELVVLHLGEVSELAKAQAMLVSGGFLYWEMKPLNWSASWRGMIKRSPRPLWAAVEAPECGLATVPHKPRFSSKAKKGNRGKGGGLQQNLAQNRWRRTLNLFNHHFAALERLGFCEVQMHWLRPNFEACLEIIPMNEAAALDYAFSRPRSDLASRLKFAAGRVMMKSSLLAHVTPCFSLIARKG